MPLGKWLKEECVAYLQLLQSTTCVATEKTVASCFVFLPSAQPEGSCGTQRTFEGSETIALILLLRPYTEVAMTTPLTESLNTSESCPRFLNCLLPTTRTSQLYCRNTASLDGTAIASVAIGVVGDSSTRTPSSRKQRLLHLEILPSSPL